MTERENKLTKKEIERRDYFEKTIEKLEREGYARVDITYSVRTINIIATFVTLCLVGIMYWLYHIAGNEIEKIEVGIFRILVALLFLGIMVLVHECIHGIMLAFYAKEHFSSVAYGMDWEGFMPYCTCNEPLTKTQYLVALVMPVMVQGVIPAIIATINGWDMLFLISLILFTLGGVDIFFAGRLIVHKTRQKKCVLIDHPYQCGFVVMEKKMGG